MFKENMSFDRSDIETNKIIAALCNIPILFWLGFVAAPNSSFVKYNANHGLIFLIAGVLVGFITKFPFIGGFLGWAIGSLVSIVTLICIVIALISKAYEIPGVDTIKLIK